MKMVVFRRRWLMVAGCAAAAIAMGGNVRVGFEDSNYFARQFRKYAGLTPTEFRRRFSNGEITLQELDTRLFVLPRSQPENRV